MDKITNAVLLRNDAPRSHVALTYGIAGILVGVLFLGNK